jgi:prophage regulatory protein
MRSKSETSMKQTNRRQQLREIVPLADSTIYEMEPRGEFPLSIWRPRIRSTMECRRVRDFARAKRPVPASAALLRAQGAQSAHACAEAPARGDQADFSDLIYAPTAGEVLARRKAFLAK